jgi:MFS transporter, YNFM family, putative membrane transport protein
MSVATSPKFSESMVETEEQGYLERGSNEYQRGSMALFAAGLATFAVLYCVQPLFPIYSKELGLSPAIVSLSLSVSTVLLAVSLPVASFLSDRIGRKSLTVFFADCYPFTSKKKQVASAPA